MQQNENKSCGVGGCGMGCKHGNMMIGVLVVVVLIVGGYFLFVKQDDTTTQKSEVKKAEEMKKAEVTKSDATKNGSMMKAGAYEMYDASKIANAKIGKVVLFFHASWCPSCIALDKDIREHMKDIPENVTILDVDYDKYADLFI